MSLKKKSLKKYLETEIKQIKSDYEKSDFSGSLNDYALLWVTQNASDFAKKQQKESVQ